MLTLEAKMMKTGVNNLQKRLRVLVNIFYVFGAKMQATDIQQLSKISPKNKLYVSRYSHHLISF